MVDDGRCTKEMRSRIAMIKITSNKRKKLLTNRLDKTLGKG